MAKTSQERYAEAFRALLKAQKGVIQDTANPFSLNMPTNAGLPEETFITDDELDTLERKIGAAADDNRQFARLWNIGTDIMIRGKSLL